MEHLPKLEAWHDFYVVVGTGAGALTGLLFVIVSLGTHVIAGRVETTVRAFVSPTAMYFTTGLIVSCVMLAPELPMRILGALLAADGIGGLVFIAWAKVHQRWREGDLPFMDWIWNVALPAAGFGAILASGVAIAMERTLGFHGIAASLLLLIVVGIRNAWDVALWVTRKEREGEKPRSWRAIKDGVRR